MVAAICMGEVNDDAGQCHVTEDDADTREPVFGRFVVGAAEGDVEGSEEDVEVEEEEDAEEEEAGAIVA